MDIESLLNPPGRSPGDGREEDADEEICQAVVGMNGCQEEGVPSMVGMKT